MYRGPCVPVYKENLYMDSLFNDPVLHTIEIEISYFGLTKGLTNSIKEKSGRHLLSRSSLGTRKSQKNLKSIKLSTHHHGEMTKLNTKRPPTLTYRIVYE